MGNLEGKYVEGGVRLRQIKGFFYLYSEYPRPVPRDFWMSSTPQPLCYEPIAAPLILFRNGSAELVFGVVDIPNFNSYDGFVALLYR